MKSMSILGSTGSIGTQALDVARLRDFSVRALTSNSNIDLLENQIREFKPEIAAVCDEKAARELKIKVADTSTVILSGQDGVCEAANINVDKVLNSIVGIAGLKPTLAAIDVGNDIALANKETLVAGGELVKKKAAEKKVRIYPVDSEHSAIFQSLQGSPGKKSVKRLILTASGGPFFGKTRDELKDVTVEQALKHPNWSMGAKITIDSATMMNKGLELIEAAWLFDMPADKIDILVHRQSVVHSMVEFVDNSVIAQLGVPDMRVPIQYALTYPDRYESPAAQLRLEDWKNLTFEEPDYNTFTCIDLCKQAITKGGIYPAAANAANEAANELFRQGKIGFLDIADMVSYALENTAFSDCDSLEKILFVDSESRKMVYSHLR
ncbi:MAG: 1-deoxy-D-xylulose-5-phosphate reductoisomerase [Clostridia bacterium]|nr:1-deoxy-D-xylulose-5-phosphate reductoisomerase [Clostridia bacterium]